MSAYFTIPAAVAAERPEGAQLTVMRLLSDLHPPGTVVTASMMNAYIDAINRVTAELAVAECWFHGIRYPDHDRFYGPQCRRCGAS